MKYIIYILLFYLPLIFKSINVSYKSLGFIFPIHQSYFNGIKSNYIQINVTEDNQIQNYILDTTKKIIASSCQISCERCNQHKHPMLVNIEKQNIIECNTEKCNNLDSICNKNNECSFEYSFDTSKLSGIFIKNNLIINNNNIDIPYGCINIENDELYLQDNNGFIGLNYGSNSIIEYMYNNKIINNKIFSICFSNNDGGYFQLGKIGNINDLNKTEYTKINSLNDYMINIDYLSVDAIIIQIFNFGALIDTKSSYTYFPKKLYDSILKEYNLFCDRTRECLLFENEIHNSYYYLINTKSESKINEIFDNLPVFSFGIEEGIIYKWLPKNYAYIIKDNKYYKIYLRFKQSLSSKIILGSYWMNDHNIIFDIENKKIGFSLSDCNKYIEDEKEDNNFKEDIKKDINEIQKIYKRKINYIKSFENYLSFSTMLIIIGTIILISFIIKFCFCKTKKEIDSIIQSELNVLQQADNAVLDDEGEILI